MESFGAIYGMAADEFKDCERRALLKLFWHREEPSPPGPPPPTFLWFMHAGMETEVKTKLMSAAHLARLNGLTRCRLVAVAEPEWLVGYCCCCNLHLTM
ncbi:unnamed protein product [Prunus armeniaca]|uniref:Uncharacterized protein n=1 Tax=Prunus armeniaca TaxID=36596 RepID=A0A6J5TKT0_PRUAR|nr:unnamed protein product [Prunus armeniaca]